MSSNEADHRAVSPLPVYINWPRLVSYIANGIKNRHLAFRWQISSSSIESYLDGRSTVPRFNTGIEILKTTQNLTPEGLMDTIGMPEVPVLPTAVDWKGLSIALGDTFHSGDKIKLLPKDQLEAYEAGSRHYRRKDILPMWTNGAILLNLAQDRLNATQYRLLTNVQTEIA